MNASHKGKVVLVTGAVNGIGKAIALRFAEAGAHVVVNDVSGQSAEEVKKEISDSGGSAIAIEADVSNSDQVAEMFKKATDNFETIDVLCSFFLKTSMLPSRPPFNLNRPFEVPTQISFSAPFSIAVTAMPSNPT